MKKSIFTLFLALAASVGTIFAEKVQIGDLYYNLDATNKTAEVTYEKKWDDTNYSGLTTANIPSSVEYESVTYSVTSIGWSAFVGCTGLTSITIPNSVTSICWYAFYGCTGLTSIEIPNSVTWIGDRAFYGCTGLTTPAYNAHVFAYMPTSYSGEYIIPEGIESIADGAFYECTGLTSVTIPNSVTSIGGVAFKGCTGLTSVTIPNSVTSIGTAAFEDCTNLPVIDNIRYADTYLVEAVDKTLSTYTIKDGTKWIGSSAFSGCTGLTSIEIPNSVTSIGDDAFWACTGLTSVTIPNSVTSIGQEAFGVCTGLTSVTIPNSVTSIGGYAFSGCTGLTSVTCEASTPPACRSDVFLEVDKSIPLYVPAESVEAYKAADQWKDFTNIQPIKCLIASGTCGENLTWELSCDSVLTISGTGEMTSNPWSEYSSFIRVVDIQEGVTSIGEWAFSGCSSLTDVTLPNSITSISYYAFSSCTNLTNVTIPSTITYIDEGAFSYTGLTSVTIPKNVADIGDMAFYYCQNLRTVTWNAISCSHVGGLGSQVESFVFGDEVETIPKGCCSGMEKLTSITIPTSVTTIGEEAFSKCYSLTSIEIPSSVMNIGNYAFAVCRSMTSINVSSDNTMYSSLDGVLFDKNQSILVEYPCGRQGTYIIPNTVTKLENGAFACCGGLEEVNFPSGITSIPDDAFLESGLTSVIIPSSVQNIGYCAFLCCGELTKLTIPSSITYIGDHAFDGCPSLSSVTCESVTPLTCVYEDMFHGGDGCTGTDLSTCILYVPASSVDAYRAAAEWSGFTNIQPIQAEEVPVTEIEAEPTENSVVIGWPEVEGATVYTIQIWKGDELICTLSFNEQGQLLTISFEKKSGKNPSRNATQTAIGWQYTISGLDAGTEYTYIVVAKNGEEELFNETKQFTTTMTTAIDEIANVNCENAKILRNGHLFILRDGKTYTVTGAEVR